MNHIFRTVWSEALNAWVAVSELVSAKGKRSGSSALNAVLNVRACQARDQKIRGHGTLLQVKLIALVAACCFGSNAQANPIGAEVVHGTATINQTGNILTVTNSPSAIINWQGFSINQNETTNFVQQSAASSVLNRVVGADPSQLLGALTSNGKVFLINPAGILVGQGARIDVAGFVASTLNLSNEDFLAGKLNFTSPNSPLPLAGEGPGERAAGSVINNGTITTPEGGSVYLIAPDITNEGIITTPGGETLLAAGNTVQLIDTGTPGVTVQVTGSDNSATNLGHILADSGRIGMVGAVVRNSGTVSASSLISEGGRVFLKATQRVEVTGAVTASSTTAPSPSTTLPSPSGGGAGGEGALGSGGSINISAPSVALGGTIAADGSTQGGNITIAAGGASLAGVVSATGGSGQGGSIAIESQTTNLNNVHATLDASGANGGSIREIAGHQITSSATYLATGTAGNGGHIDISAPATKLLSAQLDASGTTGGGQIRVGGEYQGGKSTTLNPFGVSLSNPLPNAETLAVSAGSTIKADGGLIPPFDKGGQGGFAGSGDGGTIILWSDLESALYADVSAKGKNGGAGGFIELSSAEKLVWGGTANAGVGGQVLMDPKNIVIQDAAAGSDPATGQTFAANSALDSTITPASITAILDTGSALILQANNDITVTNAIIANNLTGNGGDLTLQAGRSILVNADINTDNGALTLTANDPGADSAYRDAGAAQITVVGGVTLNAGTGALNLTATGGNLNIGGNVSAGIFTLGGGTWNQIAATLPGFTVTDFRIAGGTFIRALGGAGSAGAAYQLADIYGVQGMGSAGMLGNNYVLANDIDAAGTVNWNAGAGFAPVGNINTPFTGSFNGQGNTISNLSINLPAINYVGLFGETGTTSTIQNVGLVGGSVIGNWYVGGLVGHNYGSISNSSASGNMTGSGWYVGGLVGVNKGTITDSYSIGSVSGNGYSIGGLVGVHQGAISRSYSSSAVVGAAGIYIGGLVGENYNGFNSTITDSYATGSVSGSNSVGGLVGYNGSTNTITNSYATGSVLGSTNVGGLVGGNSGAVIGGYWNTVTSGQATSAGGSGLTTAQMMQMGSFAGWNIADTGGSGAVWRIYEGHTYPLLRSFLTPLSLTDTSITYNGVAQSGATTALAGVLGAAATGANAGSYVSGYYSIQQGYDIAGGNLTIAPASLTVTANPFSKVYDGIAYSGGNGVTYAGFVNSEPPAVLAGALAYTGTSQGAVNAGSYLITPGGLTSGNYTISFIDGVLTINPPITPEITTEITQTVTAVITTATESATTGATDVTTTTVASDPAAATAPIAVDTSAIISATISGGTIGGAPGTFGGDGESASSQSEGDQEDATGNNNEDEANAKPEKC